MGDADNEILTSNFIVAEMWQRLPIFLKDEIFGYLNVEHGNRLSRVATDWEVSLARHAPFNRGYVFFQWPEKPFEHFCWCEDQIEQFFWKKEGLKLKEGTVKHFVVLDMTATRCLYHRDVIGAKISGPLQPISTITFYRSEIFSGLLERSVERLLEKASERLQFFIILECCFIILMAHFCLPKNTFSG
ncbi:hypothetical protein RvY_11656 [Ramazzottius varieornatus]|uniref:F-box domain-containing protein n=1 Tax=Ramazzottius varieornatus TaxID=947166 RepID=A0A1D1VM85_RAMVA|nr:hypothetical protein RvY_11656 [Ramazzottius varieornatus]